MINSEKATSKKENTDFVFDRLEFLLNFEIFLFKNDHKESIKLTQRYRNSLLQFEIEAGILVCQTNVF